MYIAGSNVIVYSIPTNQQKILPLPKTGNYPTAFGISRDRLFVAVAEFTPPNRPVVCVYAVPSFRCRRTLTVWESYPSSASKSGPKQISSVCFSNDGKKIACITSDYFLSLWFWEKSTCYAIHFVPHLSDKFVHESPNVNFNLFDSNLVAVFTASLLRIFNGENTITQAESFLPLPVAEKVLDF